MEKVDAGSAQPATGPLRGDNLYLDFVGRKTFYVCLAMRREELFQDDDFADIH